MLNTPTELDAAVTEAAKSLCRNGIKSLSNEALELKYRSLIWQLYVLDSAPVSGELPDEWYVAHAALEAEAFDLLMESCSRSRWGVVVRAEPLA